ncbi:MAG: DUF6359 domain-containing protein [Prevotellaceae bacterium]|jgi:hypothetical protein|nr:DUF6359 domain-containing protein [Prevotellaceae bacterium]
MKKLKLFSMIALAAMFVACGGKDTKVKFTSAAEAVVAVGGELNFAVTVKVEDASGDTKFAFQGLPDWVNKTEGDNRVTLTGTAPSEADTYTVTVKATNNKVTATQTLTIKVGGGVSTGDGDGTQEKPYNVAQTIGFYTAGTQGDKDNVWVGGYIVGGVANTLAGGAGAITAASDIVWGAEGVRPAAVVIADSPDETDWTKVVIVKLTGEQDDPDTEQDETFTCPADYSPMLNLNNKPCNIGEYLKVKGVMYRYFAQPAVREVSDFVFTEQDCGDAIVGTLVTTDIISNAIPDGWTYITNNPEYPDPAFYTGGSLKVNFENIGLQSPSFEPQSSCKVYVDVATLNANTKTAAASEDVFTITGLSSTDEVIVTGTIQNPIAATGGQYSVTLTGEGICKVKVLMTGYPVIGTTYYNVSLKSVTVAQVQ